MPGIAGFIPKFASSFHRKRRAGLRTDRIVSRLILSAGRVYFCEEF
jgi:hypothetical protein